MISMASGLSKVENSEVHFVELLNNVQHVILVNYWDAYE